MNPNVKQKWVEALRSGKYAQVPFALKTTRHHDGVTGFCTLGVLTDLYLQERGGTWAVYESKLHPGKTLHEFEGCAMFLPETVRAWAGLECDDPRVIDEDGRETTLQELNDHGASFGRIADLIETEL